MKKQLTKFAALSLAALMGISALTACGTAENSASTDTEESETVKQEQQNVDKNE